MNFVCDPGLTLGTSGDAREAPAIDSDPFVERERELADLTAALDSAIAGSYNYLGQVSITRVS